MLFILKKSITGGPELRGCLMMRKVLTSYLIIGRKSETIRNILRRRGLDGLGLGFEQAADVEPSGRGNASA
jgi:hypothetical protein